MNAIPLYNPVGFDNRGPLSPFGRFSGTRRHETLAIAWPSLTHPTAHYRGTV